MVSETRDGGNFSTASSTSHRNNNTEWVDFPMPYISDGVDYKIRTIFRKECFSIRKTHKSTTIRLILKPKNSNQSSCLQPDCATSKDNLCFVKNVVYKFACNDCSGKKHMIASRNISRNQRHLYINTSKITTVT